MHFYFFYSHGRWLVGYDDEQGCFWEYASRRAPESDSVSRIWASLLATDLNHKETT